MDKHQSELQKITKGKCSHNAVEKQCAYLVDLACCIRNWKIPKALSKLQLKYDFGNIILEIVHELMLNGLGEYAARLEGAFNKALEYANAYDAEKESYEDHCKATQELEGCLGSLSELFITLEKHLRRNQKLICDLTSDKVPEQDGPNKTGKAITLDGPFAFNLGQVFYDGKDLDLPTGYTIEVLKKLYEHKGNTVGYKWLNNDKKENAASQDLRKAKSVIKKYFEELGVPWEIKAKPREGYVLKEI